MALAGLGVADVLAIASAVLSRAPQIDFGELLLILEPLLLAQLGRARREELFPPLERNWHQAETTVRRYCVFVFVFRIRIGVVVFNVQLKLGISLP